MRLRHSLPCGAGDLSIESTGDALERSSAEGLAAHVVRWRAHQPRVAGGGRSVTTLLTRLDAASTRGGRPLLAVRPSVLVEHSTATNPRMGVPLPAARCGSEATAAPSAGVHDYPRLRKRVAQCSRGREAVHSWHGQVHDDDVSRLASISTSASASARATSNRAPEPPASRTIRMPGSAARRACAAARRAITGMYPSRHTTCGRSRAAASTTCRAASLPSHGRP